MNNTQKFQRDLQTTLDNFLEYCPSKYNITGINELSYNIGSALFSTIYNIACLVTDSENDKEEYLKEMVNQINSGMSDKHILLNNPNHNIEFMYNVDGKFMTVKEFLQGKVIK